MESNSLVFSLKQQQQKQQQQQPQQQQLDLANLRVRTLTQHSEEFFFHRRDSVRLTNCDEGKVCPRKANIDVDEDRIPIGYHCEQFVAEDEDNDSNIDNDNDPVDTDTTTTTLSTTTLTVDYEALVPPSANIEDNVRQLHWRILLAAVEETGMDKCRLKDPSKEDATRRALNEDTSATITVTTTPTTPKEELPILYLIANNFEESSLEQVPCSILSSSESVACLPVRTALTLGYQGFGKSNDEQAVHDYVFNFLEKKMMERSYELRVKDVETLEYVGQFLPIPPPSVAPTTPNSPDFLPSSESSSIIRISTLISTSSAVVLIFTLLAFRRHKRKEDDEPQETFEPALEKQINDLDSLESGVAPTSSGETSEEVVSKSFSSGTDEDPVTSERQQQQHSIGLVPCSSSGSESDIKPCNSDGSPLPSPPSMGDHLIDLDEERKEWKDQNDDNKSNQAVILAVDSNDSEEGPIPAVEAISLPSTLPPRPPRRESVKLKKHRRRKRRKRKSALVRRNSREAVNQMEAIPESESEGSELGSEEGSEFTSEDEDEDDDYDELGSSTNQGSDDNETFPADVGSARTTTSSNFDFVIEAPDFPYGRESNRNNNNKESSTLKKTGESEHLLKFHPFLPETAGEQNQNRAYI